MRRRGYVLSGLFLALLLGLGALWYGRESLTDRFVHPWLIDRVAEGLAAEVHLEHLAIDWQRITLTGLAAVKNGDYEARIDKIVIRFSWRSLLQRRLTAVTLQGPELLVRLSRTDASAAAGFPDFPQSPPLQIDAWSIEQGRLRFVWPAGQIRVARIDAEGQLGQEYNFQVAGQVVDKAAIPFNASGHGVWRDGVELTLDQVVWDERPVLPEAITLRPGSSGPLNGRIAMDRLTDGDMAELLAVIAQKPPWPDAVKWQLNRPELGVRFENGQWDLRLSLTEGALRVDGRRWMWGRTEVQVRGDGAAWQILGSAELAASGRLHISGRWSEDLFAGDWQLAIPRPDRLARALGQTLPQSLSRFRNLQIGSRIEADRSHVALAEGDVTVSFADAATIRAAFRGGWRERDITAHVDTLVLTGEGRRENVLAGSGQIRLPLETSGGRGHFRVSCDGLSRLAELLDVPLPQNLPALNNVTLEGDARWHQGTVTVPVAVSSEVKGFGLTGRLAAEIEGVRRPGGTLRADIRNGTISGLEYEHPDGSVVVTGGRLSVTGSVDQQENALVFVAQGEAGVAEMLAGRWYASLAALPVAFRTSGRWSPDAGTLAFDDTTIAVSDLATAHLHGRVSPDGFRTEGRVDMGALHGAFEQNLHRLAADLLPQIDQLALSGRLSTDVRIERRGSGWRLDLTLRPEGMTVGWNEGVRLAGLQGHLPIQLSRGDWPEGRGDFREGRLAWKQLRGMMLDPGPGVLRVMSVPNLWQLAEPLEVGVAGGRARLNALKLTLVDLQPELQASLRLDDIDLARAAASLGWPGVRGRVNATFPDLHLGAGLVRTGGEATVRVFDGDFLIRNMRIREPLSRFPTYQADVDFSGVNLSELTRVFAFGEINGTADGYVHDLRLFDGIPSSFSARFETRQEGTRNISVAAIKNLNTLSQGGLSSALSSGIYQFIDFYRYRKIGVVCSLRNDLFHLEGTAREDSDAYLVDGGWLPPKIDVIVSSPTISFREMVRRLKRIERTGD